jgi:predicted DCC family thiol-disulfide oxidoreductase YuxK
MAGLLVFDGDCAFCSSAVAVARKRIRPDADMVPWQVSDLETLGLTEAACREAVHYRDSGGEWSSAGRAVTTMLRDGRRPWSWLGRIGGAPVISWLVERCYRLVAANRYRLPGGTPACRVG